MSLCDDGAEVYLVIIIVFVTLLLKAVSRFMQKMT